MEDIVHDCSYFENDAEFYWEPVKLFEGRSDVNKSYVDREVVPNVWSAD